MPPIDLAAVLADAGTAAGFFQGVLVLVLAFWAGPKLLVMGLRMIKGQRDGRVHRTRMARYKAGGSYFD